MFGTGINSLSFGDHPDLFDAHSIDDAEFEMDAYGIRHFFHGLYIFMHYTC